MTMSYFIFMTIPPHSAGTAHARPAARSGELGPTVFINAMLVS